MGVSDPVTCGWGGVEGEESGQNRHVSLINVSALCFSAYLGLKSKESKWRRATRLVICRLDQEIKYIVLVIFSDRIDRTMRFYIFYWFCLPSILRYGRILAVRLKNVTKQFFFHQS